MAARAGVELTTLLLKAIDSTNAPPRLTKFTEFTGITKMRQTLSEDSHPAHDPLQPCSNWQSMTDYRGDHERKFDHVQLLGLVN